MIGIGGSGMSSMALYLKQSGAILSGSDMGAKGRLNELEELGIRILSEGRDMPQNLDLVVFTAAVDPSHPEVKKAVKNGAIAQKYAEMLGLIMMDLKGVAVAGTHGKTSVAGLCAYLLKEGGLDPSFIVGGQVPDLNGGGGFGRSDLFVAEACEFDRSFLNLDPKWAVITNLEPDHLDYYGSTNKLIEAFEQFLFRLETNHGNLIVCDEAVSRLNIKAFSHLKHWTYGFSHKADLRIHQYQSHQETVEFALEFEGRDLGSFQSPLMGRHNALNAMAAVLLCLKLGAPLTRIKGALSSYKGVKRRMEELGVYNGVRLISDYAHHPTEIKAVLESLKSAFPESRLVAAYQGHQNWRTEYFLGDFGKILAGFDLALILDTFSVRESHTSRRQDGHDLVRAIEENNGRSFFMGNLDEAPQSMAPLLKQGDVLVLMGAGTIDEISGVIKKNLSSNGKCASEKKDLSGSWRPGASAIGASEQG